MKEYGEISMTKLEINKMIEILIAIELIFLTCTFLSD
jgi:hypothetical protein